MADRAPVVYRAAFETLGCRVNQYETRAVEEAFTAHGFSVGRFTEKCDVYVINTCTVTAESDRKSRQMIRRARKSGGEDAVVIALGCMVQVSPDETAAIKGLDLAFGTRDKLQCVQAALALLDERRVRGTRPAVYVSDLTDRRETDAMRVTGADTTRAFVKIADGCDNRCAYCVIPQARGEVCSKAPEDVCREVTGLVNAGYREVVLTGIETAAYGKDRADADLITLLEQVNALPVPLDRIRLGSLEPTVFKPQVVARLAALDRLMPHFHLSMQSGSSRTLAAMRRKYNASQFFNTVSLLKNTIPDLLLTTDIIVGFPGETEEQFSETVESVQKCGFSFVHIFPYSDRKGTEAAAFADKVPEEEKIKRAALLKEQMLSVRKDVLSPFFGTQRTVLVETVKNGFAAGYTDNYIEVRFPSRDASLKNRLCRVTLEKFRPDGITVAASLAEVIG